VVEWTIYFSDESEWAPSAIK